MPSEFPEGCLKLIIVVPYNNDPNSSKMPAKALEQMNNEEGQVNEGAGLFPLLPSPLCTALQCSILSPAASVIPREPVLRSEGQDGKLTAPGRCFCFAACVSARNVSSHYALGLSSYQ